MKFVFRFFGIPDTFGGQKLERKNCRQQGQQEGVQMYSITRPINENYNSSKVKSAILDMCKFRPYSKIEIISFRDLVDSMQITFKDKKDSSILAAHKAMRSLREHVGADDCSKDFKRDSATVTITGKSRDAIYSEIESKLETPGIYHR